MELSTWLGLCRPRLWDVRIFFSFVTFLPILRRFITVFVFPMVAAMGPGGASASVLVTFMVLVGNALETRISFMVTVARIFPTNSVGLIISTSFALTWVDCSVDFMVFSVMLMMFSSSMVLLISTHPEVLVLTTFPVVEQVYPPIPGGQGEEEPLQAAIQANNLLSNLLSNLLFQVCGGTIPPHPTHGY